MLWSSSADADRTIVSATMNLAKALHGVPPKRVSVVHGAHNDLGVTLLTDETRIDAPQGATPYSANFSALLSHSRRNNRVPLSTEDVARVTGSKGRQMHALCACTHVRTRPTSAVATTTLAVATFAVATLAIALLPLWLRLAARVLHPRALSPSSATTMRG